MEVEMRMRAQHREKNRIKQNRNGLINKEIQSDLVDNRALSSTHAHTLDK